MTVPSAISAGRRFETLFSVADAPMYESKQSGRTRWSRNA